MDVKRGDVVLVSLSGVGSEQNGLRPCIICSNDLANKFSPVITVVPLTSKVFKKEMVTHFTITKDMYPIHTDSVALCEQIMSIDKTRISGSVLFKLNQLEMVRLNKAVSIQLGLVEPIVATTGRNVRTA